VGEICILTGCAAAAFLLTDQVRYVFFIFQTNEIEQLRTKHKEFLSSEVVCILGTPPGRQRVAGSSFPFSAIRALTRAAAQGRYGKPPFKPQPASKNCGAKGMS
jgi:hypothetical protein